MGEAAYHVVFRDIKGGDLAMVTFDAPIVASIITSTITVLVVAGGGLYWFGKLGNRVMTLETNVSKLQSAGEYFADRLEQLADRYRLLAA